MQKGRVPLLEGARNSESVRADYLDPARLRSCTGNDEWRCGMHAVHRGGARVAIRARSFALRDDECVSVDDGAEVMMEARSANHASPSETPPKKMQALRDVAVLTECGVTKPMMVPVRMAILWMGPSGVWTPPVEPCVFVEELCQCPVPTAQF